MIVPIVPDRVGIQAPQVAAPKARPVTEGVAGLDVAAAAQRVGDTVQNIAAQLGEHLIAKRRQEAQQDSHDRATNYATEMQGFLSGTDNAGNATGLLARMGSSAKGALAEFDAHDAELREKYVAGIGDEERRAVAQLISSHGLAYRGRVVQHELEQTEQAHKTSDEAAISAFQNTANAAIRPADFRGAMDSAVAVLNAAMDRHGIADPVVRELNIRTLRDQFAKSYAEAHSEREPEKVEAMLASLHDNGKPLISEAAADAVKDHVTGSLISSTANRLFGKWTADAKGSMRADDGQLDMVKVAAKVNADPAYSSLTGKQRQNLIDLVGDLDTEASRRLDRLNKSRQQAFYSKVYDPQTQEQLGIEGLKKMAHEYAPKMRTGADNLAELESMRVAVDLAFRREDGKNDPDTLIAIESGINDGSITSPAQIVEAMKAYRISKQTGARLIEKLNAGRTPPIENAMAQIMASDKVQAMTTDDQRAFKATLIQQRLEQRIADPAVLMELARKNLDVAPTGERGFWNKVSFGMIPTVKTQDYHKSAQDIQQNRELVQKVGGTEAAVALGQRIGGVDLLAPGTPESRAVMKLVSLGANPARISKVSIEAALKKWPYLSGEAQ